MVVGAFDFSMNCRLTEVWARLRWCDVVCFLISLDSELVVLKSYISGEARHMT